MSFVELLSEKLEMEEGCELMPYHCPEVAGGGGGRLSIGIGRNLEDRGITKDEALFLLANDIAIVQDELAGALPFYSDAPECVRLVLCDMTFNLGLGKLLKFKNMLAALERGDLEQAAHELLDSLYCRQLPARAQRNAELLIRG